MNEGELRDPRNSEEYRIAAERFVKFGPLSVTAADHQVIMSTPPKELAEPQNTGKTFAQIWTEEKIRTYLIDNFKTLKDFSELSVQSKDEERRKELTRHITKSTKELKTTIEYLKSIGKLPEGFENITLDPIKHHPSAFLVGQPKKESL